MIIDVHIHLSPPTLSMNRAPWLEGEPGLAALYSDPAAKLTTTSTLLRDLDEARVDKALVMGFPFAKYDNARRHNDWLGEECLKHPGRLYPLAAFDPRAEWAPRLAEDYLDSGFLGLGELCVYDEGLTENLTQMLEMLGGLCRARDKAMLVHVNEPIGHQYPGKAPMEISQIHGLVQRCQGVKLILAHFGGGLPLLAYLRKEVREFFSSVVFDTAAMPFIFEPKSLRAAADVIGVERLVLGTDYPLLKTARYHRYFTEAGLTEAEIDLVMGLNAAKFLGI
jgi:predicted TIM-barrel fold metal-dependent hydrolase